MEDNSGLTSAPIVPNLPDLNGSPMDVLNTPKPIIAPLIPTGTPQNIHINEQLTGDYSTGPMPGAQKQNQQSGTLDFVSAAAAKMGDDSNIKDQFKYGRAYSYGAGHKNMNFDRYYKHDKFKELGFTPYRDNEALYNEKGSWWDDFNRMRGEWTGLAWGGMKSVWGSEIEANENMEKGMAIGSSSRGGLSGGLVNFGLNSAYTVGIMAELAVENAAVLALEGLTMGGSTPLTTAELARDATYLNKLAKAWKGTSDFIKEVKTAANAKEAWNLMKAGDKVTDFAKWANPLSNSIQGVGDLVRGTNGFQDMKALGKTVKTFGNFYKDIREINLAHSESKLEGEGAAVEYQNQLIDDYYAEHGKMPEGADAQKIFDDAQSVKSTVTLANDLTIYYSNKLVFDDLFKGMSRGSKMHKAILKGTDRILKRTAAKEFTAAAANAASFDAVTTAAKTKDFLLKSEYMPWSRKYFLGNLGEALQENAQEVITQSALDYYSRIHSDPSQIGTYSSLDAIGKGLSDQFSEKGFETFLSGYMMGNLIQVGGKVLNKAKDTGLRGGSAIVNAATKGKYGEEWSAETEEQRAEKQAEKSDNEILNAYNTVTSNLMYGNIEDRADSAAATKLASEGSAEAAAAGDERSARDLRNESQINHFEALAKSDNLGLISDHVDDMLTLEDEDLVNAYDGQGSAAEIRTKLTGLKDKALSYQKGYEKIQKDKPNPYNPWMFNPKKNPEAYSNQLMGYLAHEQAMHDMLFSIATYDDISSRLSSLGQDLSGTGKLGGIFKGAGATGIVGTDISSLLDPTLLGTASGQKGQQIKALEDQIKILKSGTGEQKREARNLETTLDLLTAWRDAGRSYATESKKGTADADHLADLLQDTFRKYVKHIAKVNGAHVFDEDIDKAFNGVKDFIGLTANQSKIVHTINVLSDPNLYQQYVDLQKKIKAMAKAQKANNLLRGLAIFERLKRTNKMFNELYDIGLFVTGEDIKKLKEFNLNLIDFYSVADKTLIKYDSPKYKEALAIVEKYAEAAGKEVTGKDIVEEEEENEFNAFSRFKFGTRFLSGKLQKRAKGRQDERTFKDLAKQFGFDPKGGTQQVSTHDVLKAIADSPMATSREKALARRLLTAIKADRKITFTDTLGTPGLYKSGSKETLIDPRYSSHNYKYGREGHPIEHVILHELLHELTVDGLDTDPEFKASVSKMRAAAEAFMLTPEYKRKYGEAPLYGAKNDAEFVAEALTNDIFQRMLSEIPYKSSEGEIDNVWDEFITSIRKALARIFGVKADSTLLDEALLIITMKIDNKPSPTKTAAPGGALSHGNDVSNTTPVDQIASIYPTLHAALLAAYEAEKAASGRNPGFQSFIETSMTANSLIAAHNADLEKARAEKIRLETEAEAAKAAEAARLKATPVVPKFKVGDVIVSGGATYIVGAPTVDGRGHVVKVNGKTLTLGNESLNIFYDKASAINPVAPTPVTPVVDDKPDFIKQMDEIVTEEDLKALISRMQDLLNGPVAEKEAFTARYGIEVTSKVFEEMIVEKMQSLAKNIDIETLTVGKIILLLDLESVKVVLKNDGETVTLISLEDAKNKNYTNPMIVPKSEIPNTILFKQSDFAGSLEIIPDITEEEKTEIVAEIPLANDEADAALIEEILSKNNNVEVEASVKNKFKEC